MIAFFISPAGFGEFVLIRSKQRLIKVVTLLPQGERRPLHGIHHVTSGGFRNPQHRATIDLTLRDQVAYKIAVRITEKTGLQHDPNQSLDDLLETSVRQIRDTARFR
jgi:hypothetical protein